MGPRGGPPEGVFDAGNGSLDKGPFDGKSVGGSGATVAIDTATVRTGTYSLKVIKPLNDDAQTWPYTDAASSSSMVLRVAIGFPSLTYPKSKLKPPPPLLPWLGWECCGTVGPSLAWTITKPWP